jgi:hypothetical protein
VAGVLVALLATLVSGTTPITLTAQRWSELSLSRDGQHWSNRLATPLFPGRLRLVPGVTRAETFHVLNRSDEKAEVKVIVIARDRSGWLDTDKFRMRVRLDDRRWVRVRSDGSQPANHMVLRPGESVPVSVRVRLRRSAGNHSMSRHLNFMLRIRLTELTAPGRSQS